MRLLLDTQILLWVGFTPGRLPAGAAQLLGDASNMPVFSVVNLWEVAIKRSSRPEGAIGSPRVLRDLARANGYDELPVLAEHALAAEALPPIHRDPFDRLLLAQAIAEGLTLLTADARLARYPGPIRKV